MVNKIVRIRTGCVVVIDIIDAILLCFGCLFVLVVHSFDLCGNNVFWSQTLNFAHYKNLLRTDQRSDRRTNGLTHGQTLL